MQFLYELGSNVIKLPQTEEEKIKVSEEFQQISGLPGVIGCIDGTFIAIRTPAHKVKSTYVNRHDMPSMTLQAICDANKLFLDVFTGTPSKIHDARVYTLSFVSEKIPQICGDQFHLLGDSAYPLRKFLITPYRDYGNLTQEQKNFNKKFSATRVKIENSFGLLKQRWRQLLHLDFFYVDRITQFIISCCVLHNLCLMNNDNWNIIFASNNLACVKTSLSVEF
ncbi:hypothetical protein NQ315_003478 [Exocentrus adspersus]|uniref:DDE Tnp4 domain-containing protein n=1 Tax=Exocentrus adspersus TaxID=1586481 RepID=A0AAV8V5I7_9CUCU|nr:hypothetical protein NQ315_003478 [Exocentrus adspersus]